MLRIAIFGQPGSGKSTISTIIARQLSCVKIEASEAVIVHAIDMPTLPSKKTFFELLAAKKLKKIKSTQRAQAREVFVRMTKKYGSDSIAEALHARFVPKQKQDIVFSGLRGVANAQYCKLHNDFVVYLDAADTVLAQRLQSERDVSSSDVVKELRAENKLYKTKSIKKHANLVVDTSEKTPTQIANEIILEVQKLNQVCAVCVNSGKNPAITFDANGLCQVCATYKRHFTPAVLQKELEQLQNLKDNPDSSYDVMVGVSGGKDSTATLKTVLDMGLRPLAFTFDSGYLPKSTIPRARAVAKQLGVAHEVIDTRSYIRTIDTKSFQKAADLFSKPFTLETKELFVKTYAEGRKHYSVKCQHSPTFVRTCQLCRRMVVRAYYAEATKRNIPAIVLGINEWTNLSASEKGKQYAVSGVRKLQPDPKRSSVQIFHLPFILQRTSAETKKIVESIGWQPPVGEDFIESNANSCLFARSAERMTKRMLGFHPDATRLGREVTVGFITKKQAEAALRKLHPYKYTPHQVLTQAGIL